MTETKNVAVLIDGDNAQPKLLKAIIEEVSKYGKATIRRIYGDWTQQNMNGWKEIINEYAFSPIQKFSYTKGKNSTDSAMIIDAMDILHANLISGFCIVSSDSDYTGLAKRIREEGIFVMGIGEKKTPMPFVKACEVFTYCENIYDEPNQATKKTNKKAKIDYRFIDKVYQMSIGDNDYAYVSAMGNSFRKLDPSFDVRDYGYYSLTNMLKNLNSYEMVDNFQNGINYPLIRKKQN